MGKQIEHNWRWTEGRVDPADDHFKIMYGVHHTPIALVGRGQGECFTVEFLSDERNQENGSQKMMEKVKEEIDLILVKKNKKDPWAYAILRCCTNNQHSDVHWGYFPRR